MCVAGVAIYLCVLQVSLYTCVCCRSRYIPVCVAGLAIYLCVLQVVSFQFLVVAFFGVEAAVIAGDFLVTLTSLEIVLLRRLLPALPPLSSRGPVLVADPSLSRAALSPLLLGLLWTVRLVAVVGHLVAVSWVRHDRPKHLNRERESVSCES